MLDLDGPDVWPSTLTKIGEWQRQSYVREGFLTPFDAACFMASEGYGGIYSTLSKAEQNSVDGFHAALTDTIRKSGGLLEGFPAETHLVNRKEQDVYPLEAYRRWVERTGIGDGRYFERGEDAQESENPPRPSKERASNTLPTYSGQYRLNPAKAFVMARRRTLSIREFAAFYYGIDPDLIRGQPAYSEEINDFIRPLEALIYELLVDQEVPF